MVEYLFESMRSTVFVSHANPEDNVPALWLSLRLSAAGYRVWSDLTRLLGGEDFWRDVEHCIRNDCVKFIYVLTRASNAKEGPLAELNLAKKVARSDNLTDFVIPLIFDDLRSSDFNIEITRTNAIKMAPGWGSGLSQLLQKMELDDVPRDQSAGLTASRTWWNGRTPTPVSTPEQYLSNWFAIEAVPSDLYFHYVLNSGAPPATFRSPYPTLCEANRLISFASRVDLEPNLPNGSSIVRSNKVSLNNLEDLDPIEVKTVRDFVSGLLREAWDSYVSCLLPEYEFSGGMKCHYFPHAEDAEYIRARPGRRQLVGIKTITGLDGLSRIRYWHFGVDARVRLGPVPSFVVFPHVIFSDDGTTAWSNKSRMHRARRSQCKDWWNAQWRDRVLGAMSWLAKDTESITIPVSSSTTVSVSARPIEFTSPVTYEEIEANSSEKPLDDLDEDEDDEADEY